MDPKSDKGIFLNYYTNNITYRVFNSKIKVMMESINVMVDDSHIVEGTDIEEDVGTSSQHTHATENMEDIEFNIDPTGTE